MPFTILTNEDVREVLHSLTKEDIEELQVNLAEALHSYSTGDTNSPCCASSQPQRTVIKKNGVTTLFMPATNGASIGMKIVSLQQPDSIPMSKKSSTSSSMSEALSETRSDSTSGASVKSATSDMGSMTLTPASTMSSGRDSISGSPFQPPASVASSQSTTRKGSVTLLDPTGNPMGIINAAELTAFRTALVSTMLLKKRENLHTITVFGAGKQAYWHIRLALILKGDQVHHVNIINRSFERSIKLMKAFQVTQDSHAQWRKDIKFSTMSPDFVEYGRLLKEEVRKADAIFCCTPSVEPLFPAEFLISREGRKEGRFIAAIGSYAPHMCELHPDILKVAVEAVQPGHHHHHKHAKQGGVIIVDSLESCLKEAGEVIKARLKPEHLVEVGELLMIRKAAMSEIELGGPGEKGLLEWLTKGNVIFKSVGFGLTDLVVGGDVLRLARERDLGVTVEDF